MQQRFVGSVSVQLNINIDELIIIDTNSGYGASNTKKNIETIADIYSFIFSETGVVPKL